MWNSSNRLMVTAVGSVRARITTNDRFRSHKWMYNSLRTYLAAGAASAFTFSTYIQAEDVSTGQSEAPTSQIETNKKVKNFQQFPSIVLYQYEVCPYCNKVKAYLDYKGIPYTAVEVNPLTKREMKWSAYKKVPFAIIDGEQICGSSAIIDALETEFSIQEEEEETSASSSSGWFSRKRSNQTINTSAKETLANSQMETIEKWYNWVDDTLIHILPPNIYRTWPEARESFAYIANNSSFRPLEARAAEYIGALTMYFIAKRLSRKYGIERGHEREALVDAVNHFLTSVHNESEPEYYTFVGGSETPTKADIAVYGVLRSLEGYSAWNDLTEQTNILVWYNMMQTYVGTRNCALAHVVGTCPRKPWKNSINDQA